MLWALSSVHCPLPEIGLYITKKKLNKLVYNNDMLN